MEKKSESPEKKSGGKTSRHRKKHRTGKYDVTKIPGVQVIILSEITQKILGCVIGEDVTTENPWKYVSKEIITDNLELHEESSDFLPIRNQILEYPEDEVLIGYIPSDTDTNEFFVCATEAATKKVNEVIEKIQKEQEDRLYNSIFKKIGKWQPQGTDVEVEGDIVKSNRPLLEIEVETVYPITNKKIEFRLRKAEQVRDGYMEFRRVDEIASEFIELKRVDCGIQASPTCRENQAQTICKYPMNAATDYIYELTDEEMSMAPFQDQFVNFANKNVDNLLDIMDVNETINLYTDDYDRLTTNNLGFVEKVPMQVYMTLMEVVNCKNKMVSESVWHPMWPDIIAISYSDYSLKLYHKSLYKVDDVYKTIYGKSFVYIWSLNDNMQPKLTLEAPRKITCLRFCPQNANILIGGLSNGQVIVWDLRNRLKMVDEIEILTATQLINRKYMYSLMEWMKPIDQLRVIRPTVLSDFSSSHKGYVSCIRWSDPHYSMTKKCTYELTENNQFSMQFFTSSEDGMVFIWDLLKKPIREPGDYKAGRLRRLQKRPSALLELVSPFKDLHLVFKPLYKIVLSKFPLTKIFWKRLGIQYECVTKEKFNKNLYGDKYYFKPIYNPADTVSFTELEFGTVFGDYGRWIPTEGQPLDTDTAGASIFTKFHNGVLVSVCRNTILNVILTVGGTLFGLWSSDLLGRPFLWRKCKNILTGAQWGLTERSTFMLVYEDGRIEIWLLSINSGKPVMERRASGYAITSQTRNHPISSKMFLNFMAFGDQQGIFRLFKASAKSTFSSQYTELQFKQFILREIDRKSSFLKWQEEYKRKLAERPPTSEFFVLPIIKTSDNKEEKLIEKPVEEKYANFIEELIAKNKKRERDRMEMVLLEKKNFDTKDIEKKRQPLMEFHKENEKKKQRQRERIKNAEKIFHETVATIFPEMMREHSPPPPDPYVVQEEIRKQTKPQLHLSFDEANRYGKRYISANPFVCNLTLADILKQTRAVNMNLHHWMHIHRHSIYKRNRSRERLAGIEKDSTRREKQSRYSDDEDNFILKAYEPVEYVPVDEND